MGETIKVLLLGVSPANRTWSRAIADAALLCEVCADATEMSDCLSRGVDAVLLTPDTGTTLLSHLCDSFYRQPAWSHLPIVAISDAHARWSELQRSLDPWGATILDASVPADTLIGVLRIGARAYQAQHGLRASERRFEQFMEHLPGLAWIKELDGRYAYVNRAAEGAFQAPFSDLCGKVDEQIFPPETAQLFTANDRRVLDQERGLLTRETLRHDDGRIHHSIVSKFPIPGADGRPALIGGMAIDITEWKEAEIAEALLAAVVESSSDAVISMTLDGTITSWNAAAQRLYGYAADEAIGQPLTLLILPEHREIERQSRERLKRGERIEHYETVRRRKDGRLIDISVTMSPIRDRTGAIIGASKIARDITARKQTESALRRSEERFRLFAETAPCFVWTATADGAIDYTNPQWSSYIGPDSTAAPHDWPARVLHPDDLERCVAAWTASLRTGAEFEVESRIRRADGVYRWFIIRAVPLRGEHDRIIAWFGLTVDVHDHKELTEKLREADRHKDEFLATLGHELRNPLAPIQHSIEILRMETTNASLREQVLSRMERQVHHLVRLVDDLLQVSRVSRGRIDLRPEVVSLAAVVNNALETSRPLIDDGAHSVELVLPADPLLVEADAVRLSQMISNLLNNAAKFTNAGGKIRISAFADGNDIVISVRDNGVGISAAMLPRVFDMFAQGTSAPGVGAHDGLGIGLALVKTLAELHGGNVTASSAGEGQGSEFVLRLPIGAREHEQNRPTPAAAQSAEPTARVLVVDDNHDAAESLGMLLRTVGHDVTLAHDGHAALGNARARRPDVVLLDIAMPGMDGYEVAQQLRELPDFRKVLLIAVSGYREDRAALDEAGFDGYFVKPVDFGSLRARLTSHLTARNKSGAAAQTAVPKPRRD